MTNTEKVNSSIDFDKIYSSSFKDAYTLCFTTCTCHDIAIRCLCDIYSQLYDDSISFKSMDEACDYVISRANYQIYRELQGSSKKKNSVQPYTEELEDSKYFYVYLVRSALEQKALREVYVMKFFLHYSAEHIASLLKQPINAVYSNLDRARNLVALEYKSKTL